MRNAKRTLKRNGNESVECFCRHCNALSKFKRIRICAQTVKKNLEIYFCSMVITLFSKFFKKHKIHLHLNLKTATYSLICNNEECRHY